MWVKELFRSIQSFLVDFSFRFFYILLTLLSGEYNQKSWGKWEFSWRFSTFIRELLRAENGFFENSLREIWFVQVYELFYPLLYGNVKNRTQIIRFPVCGLNNYLKVLNIVLYSRIL